jgi:hypothetical protein
MSRGRRLIAAPALIAVILTAGCGDDGPAAYDGAKACGVGADRVAAVLGTDHFDVITRGATSLPAPHLDCHANTAGHDYALAVIVAPVDARTRAEQEGEIAHAPARFDHDSGGRIGIVRQGDGFTGRWVCGDMRAYVTAVLGDGYTDADGRNLMTSMADAVGCRVPG